MYLHKQSVIETVCFLPYQPAPSLIKRDMKMDRQIGKYADRNTHTHTHSIVVL